MTRHKVLFIDTETTGLDPERHEVWEFAAIEVHNEDHLGADGKQHHIFIPPTNMEYADPGAIKVNHFYERTRDLKAVPTVTEWGDFLDTQGKYWSDPGDAAKYIARLCEDAILIGNNPAFDEMMLAKFCRENFQVLAPFHRKINVVDMALGALTQEFMMLGEIRGADVEVLDRYEEVKGALRLPHSSTRVLKAAGCPENENPHTAMDDAKHVQGSFRHLWGVK